LFPILLKAVGGNVGGFVLDYDFPAYEALEGPGNTFYGNTRFHLEDRKAYSIGLLVPTIGLSKDDPKDTPLVPG
jgi:hypothetical protein